MIKWLTFAPAADSSSHRVETIAAINQLNEAYFKAMPETCIATVVLQNNWLC